MDVPRLKKLRLSRGLSLEALALEMGGLVTKQALSKYERGASKPSLAVASALAKAFRVKTVDLWAEPDFQVRYIAFRKKSRMTKGEQSRLQSCCDLEIEQRVRLQELIWGEKDCSILAEKYETAKLSDAEEAAIKIRHDWNLGLNPIANVTNTLESRLIHVIEIPSDENFDGWSAEVIKSNKCVGTAVISKRGVNLVRQRFNLAHELGHLVCAPAKNLNEEKVAHRFAGAFLAPSETFLNDVGKKRDVIGLRELQLLCQKYSLSLQAALRRLLDLEVITYGYYKDYCILISKNGWRKCEPWDTGAPEKSTWLQQTVSRAHAEALITSDEAFKITGDSTFTEEPSLIKKKGFMALPIAERRKILEIQAEKALEDYQDLTTDVDGEFYDYND